MKASRGFIQIPILIAVILGLLAVGGAGYVGIQKYQNDQTKNFQSGITVETTQGSSTSELPQATELNEQKSEVAPKTISVSNMPTALGVAMPVSKPTVATSQVPTSVATQTPTTTTQTGSTATTAQTQTVATQTVPAASQTSFAPDIQIFSVSVTPSLTSAQMEWQTNIPTNSKVFVSGGGIPSKVHISESGLSTRHVVNVTGLKSGTEYSYEIEAISGDQVAKKDSSFSTKPDEYTLSIEPDVTSIPASGWHSANIKVKTLKNGVYLNNQQVSMTTPDPSQNKSLSPNPALGVFV